jgi:hypothetical protein
MALPRLRPESTALLVIDVQERLMPTIAAAPRVEANCALLAQAAGIMGIPVICTEQYVRGLGPTVATVRNALPATAEVIEKTRFSALVDGVRATQQLARRLLSHDESARAQGEQVRWVALPMPELLELRQRSRLGRRDAACLAQQRQHLGNVYFVAFAHGGGRRRACCSREGAG